MRIPDKFRDNYSPVDIEALAALIRKTEAQSENNLIMRIERRILIRLLTRLTECSPVRRAAELKEFWEHYRRLPRSLVYGLGITALQELSEKVLFGERHE